MRRRGKFEQVRDILKAIKEGNNRNYSLIFHANMSLKPLKVLLELLLLRGLIRVHKMCGRKRYYFRYFLTDKGVLLLNSLIRISALLEDIRIEKTYLLKEMKI